MKNYTTLLCAAAGMICSLFFVSKITPQQIFLVSAVCGIASAVTFLVLPARIVILMDRRGTEPDPELSATIRSQVTAGIWNLIGMILAVIVPMLSAAAITPLALLVIWCGVVPGSLSAYVMAVKSWRGMVRKIKGTEDGESPAASV